MFSRVNATIAGADKHQQAQQDDRTPGQSKYNQTFEHNDPRSSLAFVGLAKSVGSVRRDHRVAVVKALLMNRAPSVATISPAFSPSRI